MENLEIYNGIKESLPSQESLGLEIQYLKAELKSLKNQRREDTSTIRQLNNTVANQVRTIKDQNKKILKLLNSQQIILNKDKYTFEQFFKLKCKNRTILNHLEKFLNKAPTWDNLISQNLEQFSGWIRTNAGIKDSSAMNYITQLKNIIKQGYLNSNDTSVFLKSSKPMKEKKICLKPAELRRVLQYVPVDEDESYVHKLFVICALTGCRIIDAPELKVENIDGYTLRYTPIKTKNKECYVQLSEKVKLIFTHFVQKRVTPTKKNMNDILKNIFRN